MEEHMEYYAWKNANKTEVIGCWWSDQGGWNYNIYEQSCSGIWFEADGGLYEDDSVDAKFVCESEGFTLEASQYDYECAEHDDYPMFILCKAFTEASEIGVKGVAWNEFRKFAKDSKDFGLIFRRFVY